MDEIERLVWLAVFIGKITIRGDRVRDAADVADKAADEYTDRYGDMDLWKDEDAEQVRE